MDKITKQKINQTLRVPFLIAFAAAALMVSCLFLPYATATEDYAKRVDKYPDEIIFEDMNLTAKELKNVSMVEYAHIYLTMSEQFWHDSAVGILYAALVGLIGGFSLIAALFALGKKPIPVLIFTALAFGVFAVQNWDYTDRGIIPSSSYNWGPAHTLFPAAAAAAMIAAVWMLVRKITIKKQLKAEEMVEHDSQASERQVLKD